LLNVWEEMRKALQFAQAWPHDVCRYRGSLLARVAITGLANVAIERPEAWESPFAMPTIRNRLMTWSFETEWEGSDLSDLIQESLLSLARQLQFPLAQSLVEWTREQL